MSEMVDRLAQAIYDSVQQWGALQSKTPEIQEDYRKMARAAIEAMREPTEAMSNIGYQIETDRYHRHYPQEDKCAVECWQAMIDAALKP